jgi:heme-degrading monooxygenase HmoA
VPNHARAITKVLLRNDFKMTDQQNPAYFQADTWGYLIVWEFEVKDGKQRRFEKAYGSDGDWVKLFRQDSNYLGTELIRDMAQSRRYVTLDYWTSPSAYENFRASHVSEYQRIDSECEDLTESEREIGRFQKTRTENQQPETDSPPNF